MATQKKRNTGSCLVLALLVVGLLWYLGISYLDWEPNRDRVVQLKTPKPNPVTALWTEPHEHVGESVTGTVTVPAVVSDRLFWVRPPNIPAGLLAYSDKPVEVGQDETLEIQGEVTRPSNITSLASHLSPAEREALEDQEALVRVSSVTSGSTTGELRPLDIEAFKRRPDAYAGRYVSGTARVGQVLQDDVWLLETEGTTIYALLNQDEAEPLADPQRLLGADVKVRGHVYSARAGEKARDFAPLAAGEPKLSEQPAYLFLDDYDLVGS